MLSEDDVHLISSCSYDEYSVHTPAITSPDADTVQILKTYLISDGESAISIYFVVWSENGQNHQRRFFNYNSAYVYSVKLACRLEIDALNRECALIAQFCSDHSSRGNGGAPLPSGVVGGVQ